MREMKLRYWLALLSIPIVLLITGVAYYNFTTYTPKALKRIPEVKGLETKNHSLTLEELLAPDTKELGRSTNNEGETWVLETKKSVREACEYYESIFTEKEWVKEKATSSETDCTMKFSLDEKKARVVVTKQKEKGTSLVTLDIN